MLMQSSESNYIICICSSICVCPFFFYLGVRKNDRRSCPISFMEISCLLLLFYLFFGFKSMHFKLSFVPPFYNLSINICKTVKSLLNITFSCFTCHEIHCWWSYLKVKILCWCISSNILYIIIPLGNFYIENENFTSLCKFEFTVVLTVIVPECYMASYSNE